MSLETCQSAPENLHLFKAPHVGSKDLLIHAQTSMTRNGPFESTLLYLVGLSESGLTITTTDRWQINRVVYFKFLFDAEEFTLPFRVIRSRQLLGELQFVALEFLAILGPRRRQFTEHLQPYSSPNARLYYRHHCEKAHEYRVQLDSKLFCVHNLSCGGLHFSSERDYSENREFSGKLLGPDGTMDIELKVERKELQAGGNWEYGLSFRHFRDGKDKKLRELLYSQARVIKNFLV